MSVEEQSPAAPYQRVPGVDIRSLPLHAEEAFILSRVDGQSSASAIAGITGMPAERVGAHLRRLEELGAVRRAVPVRNLSTTRSRSLSQAPPRDSLGPNSSVRSSGSSSISTRATSPAPRSPSSVDGRPANARSSGDGRAAATPPRTPTSPQPPVQVSPPPRVAVSSAPRVTSPAPSISASPPPRISASPPPRERASPPPRSPPAPTARTETLEPPSSDRLGNPQIDETLSISVELQQRILDLSSRLGELDHFELLGIPHGADRAAVKRAYFSMIGTFHPDRYFGKRIGGFTKRMEKIFQRLTEAHDVLSNAQAREEYESYLAALGRTRGLDGSSPPDGSVEDLERLLMQAEEQAKHKPEPAAPPKAIAPPPANAARSAAARQLSAPPAPAASPPVKQPPAPAALKPPPLPAQPRLPSHRPLQLIDDPVARRQALARKFGRVPPPSTPPVANEGAQNARAARQTAAAQELQQRYQQRKGEIHDQRIERYAKAAEEAIAAGNNVAALNSLKLARSLSDNAPEMVTRIDDLEKQIGSTVADSYLQRARYEETNGQYAEAARSYTRAARGRPHPDVFRSAAECYLKAGVELRLAGELAKEGVQMAPDRSDLRLTLAKIYEAAGMPQSAVRELERAQEISPESERVNQWLKRLKRGGV